MSSRNQKLSWDAFSAEEISQELSRETYKRSFAYSLRNTLYVLIIVAAAAVLVAVLLLPVLQIFGSSMAPTLEEGEYVISVKGTEMKTGDVCAFYYNNKILVKRVIAGPGDWVDISEDGTVYVNSERIDEPYVRDKAKGECNITLPYQVPDSRIFVMGDHRSVSVDSRSTVIGCVSEEQIVGKIVYCVWPFSKFGPVK